MAREGVRGGGFVTHLMGAFGQNKAAGPPGSRDPSHKAKPRTCELRIEQWDRDS